jgi:hypothetical protein
MVGSGGLDMRWVDLGFWSHDEILRGIWKSGKAGVMDEEIGRMDGGRILYSGVETWFCIFELKEMHRRQRVKTCLS